MDISLTQKQFPFNHIVIKTPLGACCAQDSCRVSHVHICLCLSYPCICPDARRPVRFLLLPSGRRYKSLKSHVPDSGAACLLQSSGPWTDLHNPNPTSGTSLQTTSCTTIALLLNRVVLHWCLVFCKLFFHYLEECVIYIMFCIKYVFVCCLNLWVGRPDKPVYND